MHESRGKDFVWGCGNCDGGGVGIAVVCWICFVWRRICWGIGFVGDVGIIVVC